MSKKGVYLYAYVLGKVKTHWAIIESRSTLNYFMLLKADIDVGIALSMTVLKLLQPYLLVSLYTISSLECFYYSF